MNVILTGGGTGGHIYPAIAIADKIKRKHPTAQILFVGTKRGLEAEIVPNSGYELKTIDVSGLNRRSLWKNVKTLRDFLKGSRQAQEIIKDFRPDLVIGTGGYVCGPLVRVAAKLKIPTYLHEQNAYPGLTNRFLSRYVDKVFLSFEESAAYFRRKEKLIVTGNPVRKSFFLLKSDESRRQLEIGEKEFVLLCFGGSLGAERLNDVIQEMTPRLMETPTLRLVFITGKKHFAGIWQKMAPLANQYGARITILPYTDLMDRYLVASDLVVSRAGALTVAEITACGKPAILIPSPHVTGNHQYFNAKVVEDRGGAILVEEKNLTTGKLLDVILRLTNHRRALNEMAKASALVGRSDSADAIYDHLGIRQKRE